MMEQNSEGKYILKKASSIGVLFPNDNRKLTKELYVFLETFFENKNLTKNPKDFHPLTDNHAKALMIEMISFDLTNLIMSCEKSEEIKEKSKLDDPNTVKQAKDYCKSIISYISKLENTLKKAMKHPTFLTAVFTNEHLISQERRKEKQEALKKVSELLKNVEEGREIGIEHAFNTEHKIAILYASQISFMSSRITTLSEILMLALDDFNELNELLQPEDKSKAKPENFKKEIIGCLISIFIQYTDEIPEFHRGRKHFSEMINFTNFSNKFCDHFGIRIDSKTIENHLKDWKANAL